MDHLPSFGKAISQVMLPTFKAYAPLLSQHAGSIKSTRRETFSYGPHPRQQLDVYTPSSSPPASSPSGEGGGGGGRSITTANPNSVFIFLYGGGFVNGAKILPNYPKEGQESLVYANLGHFFAENLALKTVIVDYRLISHGAKFPSGGHDLELAIDWVVDNLDLNHDRNHNHNHNHNSNSPREQHEHAPLDLYVMGNSAGGVHLATYLLAPDFAESRRRLLKPSLTPALAPTLGASSRSNTGSSSGTRAADGKPNTSTNASLKGVIFLSVPFHFDRALPERKNTLATYYGDHDDAVSTRSPLGLLRAAKRSKSPVGDGSGSSSTSSSTSGSGSGSAIIDDVNDLAANISVLVLKGSLDPEDEILRPITDFVDEWQGHAQEQENTEGKDVEVGLGRNTTATTTSSKLQLECLPGQHNHISPVLSLGTRIPAEEAWGRRVVDFVATTSTSRS